MACTRITHIRAELTDRNQGKVEMGARTLLYKIIGKPKPRRVWVDTAPAMKVATADFTTKFAAVLGEVPVNLFYWPDYTKGNKYQKLLYGSETPNFSFAPAPLEQATKSLLENKDQKTVFHLHWVNFLFSGVADHEMANVCGSFVESCKAFQKSGGILVWTVHNLLEHESRDHKLELKLRRDLAGIVDAIFVHGEQAKTAVAHATSVDAGKIIVAEHGNYVGAYSDTISLHCARKAFGFDSDTTVFLNLGAIRSYKGADSLFELMTDINGDGYAAKLLLAGRMRPDEAQAMKTLIADNDSVILHDAWVEHDEMQNYINAADFMVLPYKRILTSGSVFLALSFALPVVAPRLGNLSEVITDGFNGFLYNADDPDGLRTALLRAADTSPEERAVMRFNAFSSVSGMLWSKARFQLFDVIKNAAPPH